MDSIGQVVNRALQKATPGQASQPQKLAKSAKREPNGMPVLVDPEVDVRLRTLICFRHDNGALELRRPLAADERAVIEVREAALELAIEPYRADDKDELVMSIGAMFSGYRSMRQQGEDVETTTMVTLAVLREFPAWAIQKACLMIASGALDPRWPPNDAEIASLTRKLVIPYRDCLAQARKMLEAAYVR
jgi:hypothetical protein